MPIERRSAWKGLLAGALGGLAGAFAMSWFHALVQNAPASSKQDKEDSTVLAASAISRNVFHHELTPAQKKIAGTRCTLCLRLGHGGSLRYPVGVCSGCGYGMGNAFWSRSLVRRARNYGTRGGPLRTHYTIAFRFGSRGTCCAPGVRSGRRRHPPCPANVPALLAAAMSRAS